MGPGVAVCAAANSTTPSDDGSGTDLIVQEADQSDGSQVLLFWVQCVHKGALVCRRNAEDDAASPPRCLIAVKVPAQKTVAGELPPCTVTRGLRWA